VKFTRNPVAQPDFLFSQALLGVIRRYYPLPAVTGFHSSIDAFHFSLNVKEHDANLSSKASAKEEAPDI